MQDIRSARGLPSTFWKNILKVAPRKHAFQCWRNLTNPLFWRWGFRSPTAVERKTLFFRQWYSLNRDMTHGDEIPGWQFWYYELTVWIWCWRNVRNEETGKLELQWGVWEQVFRNFRKFPLARTAVEKKAYIEGVLQEVFLTRDEALHAKPKA